MLGPPDVSVVSGPKSGSRSGFAIRDEVTIFAALFAGLADFGYAGYGSYGYEPSSGD